MSYKHFSFVLLGIALGAFTMGALQFTFAWTSPAGTPPTANVAAPINVSAAAQMKQGPLGINTSVKLSPGSGLEIGGNVIVGGKIVTLSTLKTDSPNTVVTKDFLQKTIFGPVDTTPAANKVYGPAEDDFFVSVQVGGTIADDNQAEFCAGPNSALVGKCYCTGLNRTGRCDGGEGTGASYIRARIGAYSSGMAIVRKGEYWQTQHFDHKADGGVATTIIYPIGYVRISE